MVLALKTAGEITELFLFDDGNLVAEKKWPAERQLAHDLLGEIEKILGGNFTKLTGLVVFIGPGSFTGLRIGVTTMNTLAYSLDIPIVGTSGDDWAAVGITRLKNGENDWIVIPKYGVAAKITKPKK